MKKKPKKSCILISLKITKLGDKACSKPCSNCLNYISSHDEYKIKKIVFIDEEGSVRVEKLANCNTKYKSSGWKNYKNNQNSADKRLLK